MFRTTSYHFTTEDHEQMDADWKSTVFSEAKVDELRRSAEAPPIEPSSPRRRALEAVRPIDAAKVLFPTGPPWMRIIAKGRSFLTNVVFVITYPGYFRYYRFLFAKQQPTHCAVLTLTRIEYIPGDVFSNQGAIGDPEVHRWCFRRQWAGFEYEGFFDGVHAAQVRLIPEVYFTRLGYAWSDVPTTTFDEFATTVELTFGATDLESPEPDSASEPESSDESSDPSEGSSREGVDTDSDEPMLPVITRDTRRPLTDAELITAYRSAEALRQAWAIERRHLNTFDFRVVPRCGTSTYRKTGRVCDGIRGEPHTPRSKEFVSSYCRKLQFSVTYTTIGYSVSDATVMAAEWCARMQFFLAIWIAHGSDVHYIFDVAAAGAYTETPEFVA